MEKKKINFTRLVESLRWYEKEYKGSIMDEEDKKTFSLAADVLEDLLQSVAEWTARYEEARDRCNLAEKQLFFMENLVRCGECEHYHDEGDPPYCDELCTIHVEKTDGCLRGIKRGAEVGYRATDGERKDGEHD